MILPKLYCLPNSKKPAIALETILFKPRPDAWASGVLARKAINNVPITAPNAVAINTEPQRLLFWPTMIVGFKVKM